MYVLGFLFARMARDDLADVPERGRAFGCVQPLVRRMVIDLRGVRAAAEKRGGTMTLHWENEWFMLRVLLPQK